RARPKTSPAARRGGPAARWSRPARWSACRPEAAPRARRACSRTRLAWVAQPSRLRLACTRTGQGQISARKRCRVRSGTAAELLLQLGERFVDRALRGHLVQLALGGGRLGGLPAQLLIQTRLGLDRVDLPRHPVEVVERGRLGRQRRALLVGAGLG